MPVTLRAFFSGASEKSGAEFVDLDVVHLAEENLFELLMRELGDSTKKILSLEVAVPVHMPATMQGWDSTPLYDWMAMNGWVTVMVRVTKDHPLSEAIKQLIKLVREHLRDLGRRANADFDRIVDAALDCSS